MVHKLFFKWYAKVTAFQTVGGSYASLNTGSYFICVSL